MKPSIHFKVDYKLEANSHEPSLRWWHHPVGHSTSEAELQELVDRLDRVSRKYSLLINVDKTNVMASNGIACRISLLIQNKQLEQVDTFPYLGSLITEDGVCTTEFCTRLNRGQAIGASLQNIWKVTAHRFQRRYDQLKP